MTPTATSIDQAAIQEFQHQLRGKLILPEDENYNEARKVYNAMIDKHPAMIAMCADVADVIYSVNFARNNEMLVAVRGGGHNGGGLGVCDDGLVIDLSGIKYVRVNPKDKTVRVGGGNTLGEVDHATHVFKLAVPAGVVSTTGIGGLTLGGGMGYLTRKYGLTIDNLLEADIVLANGDFVTASANQNTDLFWAIRGGGGNFGIITSFLFQAHDVDVVYGGVTLWPIEETEKIMKWYQNFMDKAPDELNGFFAVLMIPGPPFPEQLHNKLFCGVVWCYVGDMNKAQEVFSPVRAMEPLFEHVGPMPYPALQSMFDGLFPPGLQWYWKADFFNELGPEVAAQHVKFGSKIPTPISQMHLYPINGAASRVGKKDTPWAYRDANYTEVIIGVDPNPANADKISSWSKDYWTALHPYSAGGAYTNFMMNEGQERVKASYKENYNRLVEIKQKYDRDNFFRVNQNIWPD